MTMLDPSVTDRYHPISNEMFETASDIHEYGDRCCLCARYRATLEATKALVTRLMETVSRIVYTAVSLVVSILQFNFNQVKEDIIAFGSIVYNLIVTINIALRVVLSPLFPSLLVDTFVYL